MKRYKNRYKKSRRNKICLILLFFLFVSLIVFRVNFYTNVSATGGTDAYLKFPNFNPFAQTGTAENPFIILEIVPYRGMGEIGYVIGGQEPVDISVSSATNNIYGPIASFAQGAFAPVKQDVVSTEDKVAGDWSWFWVSESKASQTGYFKKVNNNTGLYDLKKSNGTYIFEKNKYGTGSYNWIEEANTKNIPTDYNSDRVWMTNYTLDTSYWAPTSNWKFENLEIFKKQVLHIPDDEIDNYHVRVVTITPDKLNENVTKFTKYYDLTSNGANTKIIQGPNEEGEIDLIGNADLICISPNAHAGNTTLIDYWEKYGRDKSGLSTDPNRYHYNFSDRDLSWQTTMELFMKVGIVEDRAAFVYDITLFTEPDGNSMPSVDSLNIPDRTTGYINNVYKLCLLLRQRDPVITYNTFMNTNGGSETPSIWVTKVGNLETGSLNLAGLTDSGKVYWNEYTFLPTFPDGSKPVYISQPSPNYQEYLLENDIIVNWIAGSVHSAVIRNTYSYNGDSSVVQYFITAYNIADNTYSKYDYNAEFFDYLQDKNGNIRPSNATPCEAVEYILNWKHSGKINKDSIRILDIEPCNDFTLTTSQVRQMLPNYSGVINIERQTTAEFIGKIEDLNTNYDLIYIGQNTGKMKTDSNGKTVYNDPLLDGFVYLHVGDRVISYDTFKGILRDSANHPLKAYDFINFNAVLNNSIGQANLLKAYNSAEFNQIKSITDFYRFSGNDISSYKKDDLLDFVKAGYPVLLEKDLYNCNSKIVDDSSYLYQFLSINENKDISNMINRDTFNQTSTYLSAQKKLESLVAIEKVSIDLLSYPKEFIITDNSTLIDNKSLEFKFSIKVPREMRVATFDWNIYIDTNADGLYDEKEIVESGSVKDGDTIQTSITLNEKYKGAIPWKLEVKKQDNAFIRAQKFGLSALRLLEEEKIPIRILQITSDNSTLNLEKLLNPSLGETSIFYEYTKNLDDFHVIIKTISVTEFLKLYENGNAYDKNRPDETDKLYYMEDGIMYPYDMIILGFGHCYTNIHNENGALNNIVDFINSGRSVMFTHDTTSFVNTEDFTSLNTGYNNWGYDFNQKLRNLLGLDRFGIMNNKVDTYYDLASMPSQVIGKNLYKNTVIDGIITYPEKQGITNAALVAFSNPKDNFIITNWQKSYLPFTVESDLRNSSDVSNSKSSYVTQVNEGQITSYPYDFNLDNKEALEITETHFQYYQINMEDEEIVVWFCLADKDSSSSGPYATSPNDVRNNYYIYSKGNVMYSGVGHTIIDELVPLGTKFPKEKVNEVKLLINTIIASYSAGITAPKVKVINEDVFVTNYGEYGLYNEMIVPVDGTNTRRIEFEVNDTNLRTGDLIARIYYYHDDNKVLCNPQITSMSGDKVRDYYQVGKESGYYVSSLNEHNRYYFNFPLDLLPNGSGKVEIVVSNEKGLKGVAKVNLFNLNLFDLD